MWQVYFISILLSYPEPNISVPILLSFNCLCPPWADEGIKVDEELKGRPLLHPDPTLALKKPRCRKCANYTILMKIEGVIKVYSRLSRIGHL